MRIDSITRVAPIVAIALAGCAQSTASVSGNVPGLEPGAGGAREFAPGIISAGYSSCPAFTRDGGTIYFMNEADGLFKIMQSRRVSGGWSTPVVAPFSGTYPDIDPFVTIDGSRVIFSSHRPYAAGDTALNVFQVWSVPLTGEKAGVAEPFGPAWDLSVSRFFVSSTSDGTLYFAQRVVGGSTGNDIYRSRLVSGEYQKPEPVVALNTDFSDSNPLIAPDESFIIFFSARPGGLGYSDLYVSFRDDDSWTTPRNLGPLVNSAHSENCPAFSPDGQYLFFARGHRNEAGEVTSRNMYYVEMREVMRAVGR